MVNPRKFYTYAYLREDRTPYYIGKGIGKRITKRFKNDIKPPKDKSRVIFLKQNLTEEEAFKHEIYMIAVFGRKDLGTGILRNRTDGGDGVSGRITTEKTKRKIGDSQKGNKNHNYGRSPSKETREKLSKASKNKTHTKETKKKLSELRIGKTHTEETRKKISKSKKGKVPWNKGKKFKNCVSEDTKRKMRESHIGKKQSEETCRKKSESMKKWWAEKKLPQDP